MFSDAGAAAVRRGVYTVRLTALCLLLLACAPIVQTSDGRALRATSAAFRDYTSSVFRRHNAASIAIVDAFDAVGNDDRTIVDELEEADDRMMRACEPLNTLAIARRDGKELDVSALRAVADAVPLCDHATTHAELLISNLSLAN